MLFSAQRKAVKSIRPGIATNTAAANAFPDRGGGGYFGRALHTEVAKVSPLGRGSPRRSAGCQYLIDLGPPLTLYTGSIFIQIQRSFGPAVA
jgi:hypothetical protein